MEWMKIQKKWQDMARRMQGLNVQGRNLSESGGNTDIHEFVIKHPAIVDRVPDVPQETGKPERRVG